MDVVKTLKPNEAGTKRHLRKYGDKLVSVRYRKGVNPYKIYTTVEIIVDEKDYVPGITHVPAESKKATELVAIKIAFEETELRQRVKQSGGSWDPKSKLWNLSYKKVCDLKLKSRILKS